MPTPQELEAKFWKALKSDMTMMLGLVGDEDGHPRPMTAQLQGDHPPIWFFTSRDNGLSALLDGSDRAVATFTSKNHGLFATLHGALERDNDRQVIDRLWNPFVAAWFESKDDPKLVLLRFDAERAEIWEDASSLFAGIRMMFGLDPKKNYRDHVAEVRLR